jgi:hypothetical protein
MGVEREREILRDRQKRGEEKERERERNFEKCAG